MLADCAQFAPQAVADLYAQLELQLIEVLQPEVPETAALTASEMARILRLASIGLKASTESLLDLQRMVEGLVIMAVATVQATRFQPMSKNAD